MQTSAITSADLARSVIAVPPLCRNADWSLNADENKRLIQHLETGGISTILYGGNANFYHVALSEYAALLEMLSQAAAENTLLVPAVGPMYGTLMDQATILRDLSFPTAMVLPTLFPAKPDGVATGIRHFAEKLGRSVVLYMKDPAYITTDLAASLVNDGLISWIKYAIVRENPADDPILADLVTKVSPDIIVSGIGEQPAITHLRDFGITGFTAGCVCIAPSLSTKMLKAIQAKDYDTAETIRQQFLDLEDLRNAHSPIMVLHHAVALAGVADTGPALPLLSSLPSELISPIDEAAKKLLTLEFSERGNVG